MPLSRRQILRRRRITVFGGLGIVVATAFYLPLTLLAPVDEVAAVVLPYSAPVEPPADVPVPAYGATAVQAIGFPGALAATGTTEALPIASISKVVTALVVLDAKPIAVGEAGPSITMTAADRVFYQEQLAKNGGVKPVRAGLVLSQLDILRLVLIASANNYADTISTWAFGSNDAYVAATRAWLDRNGLGSTTIVEPSGIDPANRSTATDLVAIGELALANPVVAGIIAEQRAEIPGVGAIENTNKLLGIDGVDGIKTGTLDEAGSCLLFSADIAVGQSTVTVVGVVLGGPDHETIDADIRGMLAGITAGFREVTLVEEGTPFASYSTEWGDDADAVAAETATMVVWADTPITALVQADEVRLATEGTDVGGVTFTIGTQRTSIDLVLDDSLDDPGPWWRLTHPALLG